MNEQKKEEAEKESDEYDDTDDEELEVDDILIEAEDSMGIFSQIDESNKLFGSSIQDIINVFGCCVLVIRVFYYQNNLVLLLVLVLYLYLLFGKLVCYQILTFW